MVNNTTPDDMDGLREHFQANLLDGDAIQDGQMLASTAVWEWLEDYLAAHQPKQTAPVIREIGTTEGSGDSADVEGIINKRDIEDLELPQWWVDKIEAAIQHHTAKACLDAREDENDSILRVAKHEIALPGHCDNHDKHVNQCHACQRRKWFRLTGKRLKEVIDERLADLQTQRNALDKKKED